MKKAVVMLITLFFILSITLIIIKNLDDSNEFIKEINVDKYFTQLKVTDQNFKDEIFELIKKHKDNIDDILEVTSLGIPFNYGDLNLTVVLQEYTVPECYLNDIKKEQTLYDICNAETVDQIMFQYDFRELLDQYKPLNSQDQIDYFISEYKQLTKDDQIDEIVNSIGYIKPLSASDSNSTDNRYLEFTYSGKVQDSNITGKFIFDLNNLKIKDSSLVAD